MSEIIYIASYPKSGNTWFRMFITNLNKGSDDELTINDINIDGMYSNRQTFDDAVGIKASMLNCDMVDELRPAVYENIAKNIEQNIYIKVHDAFTYLSDNRPLINSTAAKVVYIIRNPLDVAVSFSDHYKKSIDETVANMNNPNYVRHCREFELYEQLRQKLLSWSGHVKSYADAKKLPVHFLRYEDMKFDSFNAFKKAVDFIGLDVLDEDIKSAIEQTDFNKLKKQEIEQGFIEKPYQVEKFFRKGKVGDWRNHLTQKQAKAIIECHGKTMRKYGYLNEKGQPIF